MQIFNLPIRTYFSLRSDRLRILHEEQCATQAKWLSYLLTNGEKTQFGREHGLHSKMSYTDFANHVPLQTYNSLFPYIERIIRGEDYILWNNKINWVAKSSGTTAARSKFIPVSMESLKFNNYMAARDNLTGYCALFPDTNMFAGKGITLGGSFQEASPDFKVKCGDVSAILMDNMPVIGDFLKAPGREILLQENWHKKLKLIAQNTVNENITSISGVPSWMLLVLKEVLNLTNKKHILEVWENFEVYFHGGVAFAPYKEEFQKLFPLEKVFYLNVYNASEGFFGFQLQKENDDLILLTDHAVFYEFVPAVTSSVPREKKAIPLSEVEIGQNYAMIITTAAGLWRYEIGDTIQFTSKNPYKFKITGRTTQYINTFGEELIVDNADQAIEAACRQTDAIFAEYSAAPIFFGGEKQYAAHEWLIEFLKQPADIQQFTQILDQTLKQLNSDYEAKRTGNLMLREPQIKIAPQGTFMRWLERKNKLGGQHKVPRLQNDRKIMEEICGQIE